MTARPDVSVVVGVYNGEDYLAESIESILAQSGVSLELLIVDDGSTDSSLDIAAHCARQDARVIPIRQEHQGLTCALIRGCAAAQGLYIARHDVGDISLPDRLRLQRDALDARPSLSFVSCWSEFCGPELEFLHLQKGTGKGAPDSNIISDDAPFGLADGPSHHGSVMFRTAAYREAGGYRPQFYYGQDYDLWYRLAETGTFQMVPQTLYRVRLLPASISLRNKQKQEAYGQLSLAAHRCRRRGEADAGALEAAAALKPASMARAHTSPASGFYFIGEGLRRNRDNRAARYLAEAIRRNPWAPKPWVRLLQYTMARGCAKFTASRRSNGTTASVER